MNYFNKYLKYKKKYFNLKSEEKQYGGESKILQNILAIAKKQFYEEYSIDDELNKSEIFKKITSLSSQ